MTLDLDELERLALAATPGPWAQGEITRYGVFAPNDTDAFRNPLATVPGTNYRSQRPLTPQAAADAEYIAAASPDVVLRLVDEARRYRNIWKSTPLPDEDGCEHGYNWDRSCDSCGRTVSGIDA